MNIRMMRIRTIISIPMTSIISIATISRGVEANRIRTPITTPGYGIPILIFQTSIIVTIISALSIFK